MVDAEGPQQPMDLYTHALGDVVRAEVARRRIRSEDIPARLKLSRASYHRYFVSGERSPDVATLRQVAAGLELTMPALWDLVEAEVERLSR